MRGPHLPYAGQNRHVRCRTGARSGSLAQLALLLLTAPRLCIRSCMAVAALSASASAAPDLAAACNGAPKILQRHVSAVARLAAAQIRKGHCNKLLPAARFPCQQVTAKHMLPRLHAMEGRHSRASNEQGGASWSQEGSPAHLA
jgi:hypothetical protein